MPGKTARLRELDGRTSVLTRGDGTEFDSLREYVPGDDIRSIDWRATARQSNVAVRTWHPERDPHIVIALDTGRTSAGRVGDVPKLDAAMEAALLLAALASRAGDRVNLLAHDTTTRATGRGRSAHNVLPAFVDAIASLEPALVESDARSLVTTLLGLAPQRSLIVLLTGLDTTAVQEDLLSVLPLLTRWGGACPFLGAEKGPVTQKEREGFSRPWSRETLPLFNDCSAASYSPTRSRMQYHRR